jgi:non-heme chloroperoxidase
MTKAALIAVPASLLVLCSFLSAQDISGDRDTTPHSVRFVNSRRQRQGGGTLRWVRWANSSAPRRQRQRSRIRQVRPETDRLVPRLGITRRGSGAASTPAPTNGNYSADRLGDDVLAVINDLKLDHPILVGHSLGGQGLSSVGSRNPSRFLG